MDHGATNTKLTLYTYILIVNENMSAIYINKVCRHKLNYIYKDKLKQ